MTLNVNNIDVSKTKDTFNIDIVFDNWHFDINSPLTKSENLKIVETNKKTSIKFDIDSNKINGFIQSLNFNSTLKEIFEIWDNISFLFENNSSKMDYEIHLDVNNILFFSDKFIYSISKLSLTNVKEYIIMNNIFYFNINEFIMSNKKNVKLVFEKEFTGVWDLRVKDENNFYVIFFYFLLIIFLFHPL